MNNGIRRTIVCRGFCSFYKPGKKEPRRCGAYEFLADNLTVEELRHAALAAIRRPDYSRDREMRKLVCGRCAFLADGCDFRRGLQAPPCGGYMIMERLFKARMNYRF